MEKKNTDLIKATNTKTYLLTKLRDELPTMRKYVRHYKLLDYYPIVKDYHNEYSQLLFDNDSMIKLVKDLMMGEATKDPTYKEMLKNSGLKDNPETRMQFSKLAQPILAHTLKLLQELRRSYGRLVSVALSILAEWCDGHQATLLHKKRNT